MRNVVLVTIDAVRADHCGFMGYHRDTTPTLDRFAEEGVAFERAVSPGTNTPSSMSGIFTGEHSLQDVHSAPAEDWRTELRERRTLADRLSGEGYDTGAIHPQVHASKYFGFDQGFDEFHDFLPERESRSLYSKMLSRKFDGSPLFTFLRNARSVLTRSEALTPWESYFDDAVEWMRGAEEPFFFWTLLPDTHFPYLPPAVDRTWSSRIDVLRANAACYAMLGDPDVDISEETSQRMVDVYDDTIRYADRFLSELWAAIEDLNPVVVVHADHGEAFGEHGFYGHQPYPYGEVTEVPLVVYNADRSGTVERPFSLTELADLITGVAREGDDWLASAREGEPMAMAKVVRGGERATGVRLPRWRYVQDGHGELYDVVADEAETTDIHSDHPEMVECLDHLVDSHHRTDVERAAVRAAVRDHLADSQADDASPDAAD